MKSFLPLLLVSLAVNAVLGAVLARRSTAALPANPPASALPASAGTPAPAVTAGSPSGPGSRETAVPAGTTAPKTRDPLWTGLKGDAIEDAIARLRSAGCPPREIVFAVRALIQEMSLERRQALGFANENLPYWQAPRNIAAARPNEMNEVYLQGQRLERAYLLTPEFFGADETMVRMYRDRFGPLDHETLRRLALLDSERNEKGMQLMAAGSSTQPGVAAQTRDPRQREQLQQEYEAAVQALLTPEQYAQYELRNGQTALELRFRLASFDPTEAEYLALFALEKARRQARESAPQQTPEQRRTVQAEQQAAIQAALGPERAADYEAVQRAGGDLLPRLLVRLNLPVRTLTTINAVRDDTATRARAIRDNPQFTPEQRSAQLNALAAEAEADLGALFGTTRGLEAYKDIRGEWLRSLRSLPPSK